MLGYQTTARRERKHGASSSVPFLSSRVTHKEGAELYEIITATELSKRWNLPVTWVREYTRSRTKDPIPHIKFGHYTRFAWDSPELNQWLERHKNNGKGR